MELWVGTWLKTQSLTRTSGISSNLVAPLGELNQNKSVEIYLNVCIQLWCPLSNVYVLVGNVLSLHKMV